MTKIFSTLLLSSIVLVSQAEAFTSTAEVVYVDHRYTETTRQVPIRICETVEVPIYKTTKQSGDDDVISFILGAAIGSAVGNQVSSSNGAGAVGAIVGGALANEHQKKHNGSETTEIVGYKQQERCITEYQTESTQSYRYSRVIVDYNGIQIKLNRKNPNINVGDYINVDVSVK